MTAVVVQQVAGLRAASRENRLSAHPQEPEGQGTGRGSSIVPIEPSALEVLRTLRT